MSKKIASQLLIWCNAWLPPVVWAISIFLLSSQGILPSLTEVWHDFVFKKLAHIGVYAVLYILLYRGVSLTILKYHETRRWQLALVLCLLYAISDELHQMVVPGRYGTLRDVGYDMLGASIVLLRQHRYV